MSVAVEEGDVPSVTQFLLDGKSIRIIEAKDDVSEQSALHVAVIHGRFHVACVLIGHGAEVDAVDWFGIL